MTEVTNPRRKEIDNYNTKLIPKFFFEGNLLFKWIETDRDLNLLEKTYPNFLDAKRISYDTSRVEFGFRIEHTGKETLREFFEPYKLGE